MHAKNLAGDTGLASVSRDSLSQFAVIVGEAETFGTLRQYTEW